MNKTFLFIATLALVTLVVLAILRISSSETVLEPQDSNQSSQGGSISVVGNVSDIDLNGMAFDGPALVKIETVTEDESIIAVPSMGIRLCEAYLSLSDTGTIAIGDEIHVYGTVDEKGRIVPCSAEEHFLKVTGFVRDTDHGFEFAYRKGPDGYITMVDKESNHPDYVTGTMLFNKQEYDDFMKATDAREGPASMHVRIYKNPQKLHAPVWTMRYPQETNLGLAFGETKEVVVSGANATHFVADGLYPIDTYVVAHGAYVYVLMGSYPDVKSQIYEDFQSLVQSFMFIPASSTPS